MSKKWVYLFREVDQAEKYVSGQWEAVCGLLGGKGANLAEMVRLNIPVPMHTWHPANLFRRKCGHRFCRRSKL